jgi:thymidylate synthase
LSDLVLPNMREGYVLLSNLVLARGKRAAPRGMNTRELEDFTFTLENPLDALPLGVGRKPKLAIGAGEALLLAGGISDPTMMVNITGTMARFLDGGVLHGAYGPRIRAQLPRTVERLKKDRDTRQAVMTIWDPAWDTLDTRDVPCTIAFNFRIRNDKLNMGAVMRSNDVYLGTAYDVFMFTQLQATVARALNLPVGTYTHHAWSLHAYERNFDQIEALHKYDFEVEQAEKKGQGCHVEMGVVPAGFGQYGNDISEAMEIARKIHDQETFVEPTLNEQWYIDVLAPFERLTRIENFSS